MSTEEFKVLVYGWLRRFGAYLNRRFPRLSAFFKRFARKVPVVQQPVDLRGATLPDPAKVPAPPPRPTGRDFSPQGFAGRFDPTAHPALPELQRRAVYALFGKFGLQWVPGEYLAILARCPDPIDALEDFCEKFGVDAKLLQREISGEIDRLEQCIGILLELAEIKELSDHHRQMFQGILRTRNYGRAEQLLTIIRTVFQIIRESEALGQQIVFGNYRAFLDDLNQYRENPLRLTVDEALEAREVNRDFLVWQQRFDALIGALDSQIAWMIHNWPKNQWGRDQEPVKLGLIRVKEEIEESLKHLRNADIQAELDRLETVYQDLLQFIEEIKAHHGGQAWSAPKDDRAVKAWTDWCWALTTLGFPETAEPSADEIKKAYRKGAFEHHPDRYAKSPAAEREMHNTAFKSLGPARDILDRGKPKKP